MYWNDADEAQSRSLLSLLMIITQYIRCVVVPELVVYLAFLWLLEALHVITEFTDAPCDELIVVHFFVRKACHSAGQMCS